MALGKPNSLEGFKSFETVSQNLALSKYTNILTLAQHFFSGSTGIRS